MKDKKKAVFILLPIILMIIVTILVLSFTNRSEDVSAEDETVAVNILKSRYTVGSDIEADDITEFYYTVENINYNASYLRYRFYSQDGKHMFFFEKRERPNDYGPTTDKDTIAKAEFELSDDQWNEFFDLVKDGTVRKRHTSAESGDTGPWLYLYWKGDKGEYQEYTFQSEQKLLEFEDFCLLLSKEDD